MGLAAALVAILLFVILAVFTLMINPPNAWVNRISDEERQKDAQREKAREPKSDLDS